MATRVCAPRVASPGVTVVLKDPSVAALTVLRTGPAAESSVMRTGSEAAKPPPRRVMTVAAEPPTGRAVRPVAGVAPPLGEGATVDVAVGVGVGVGVTEGTPLVLTKSSHLGERALLPVKFRERTCQTCCPAERTGVVHVVPVSHGLTMAPSSRTTWYSLAPADARQTIVVVGFCWVIATPFTGLTWAGVAGRSAGVTGVAVPAPTWVLVETKVAPRCWLMLAEPRSGYDVPPIA